MTRPKIYIETDVFQKQLDREPTWADIKDFKFEDTDKILCEYVEAYYSYNNSWDAHFMISVRRRVLESDEQHTKRLAREDADSERRKKQRYDTYLKFKEEFEPDPVAKEPISESDIRRNVAISLITKLI